MNVYLCEYVLVLKVLKHFPCERENRKDRRERERVRDKEVNEAPTVTRVYVLGYTLRDKKRKKCTYSQRPCVCVCVRVACAPAFVSPHPHWRRRTFFFLITNIIVGCCCCHSLLWVEGGGGGGGRDPMKEWGEGCEEGRGREQVGIRAVG